MGQEADVDGPMRGPQSMRTVPLPPAGPKPVPRVPFAAPMTPAPQAQAPPITSASPAPNIDELLRALALPALPTGSSPPNQGLPASATRVKESALGAVVDSQARPLLGLHAWLSTKVAALTPQTVNAQPVLP